MSKRDRKIFDYSNITISDLTHILSAVESLGEYCSLKLSPNGYIWITKEKGQARETVYANIGEGNFRSFIEGLLATGTLVIHKDRLVTKEFYDHMETCKREGRFCIGIDEW